MRKRERDVIILLADDDDDDVLLTQKALAETRLDKEFVRVKDGEELLAYLRQHYGEPRKGRMPTAMLLLLDLNMPHMDGREALREIKSDPVLRSLPVVVLTTSAADEDVARAYDLGANSFIQKPADFVHLVDALRVVCHYWFDVVEMPVDC